MELERKILPLIFVLSGTCNVIIAKWTDTLESKCSDGKVRTFQHPFVQTFVMFLGQLLCFGIYKICYFILERRGDGSENWNSITRGGRLFSPFHFILPALLDTLSTFMLFTALYLTYASTFQMLRSAAIIFVCIFNSIHTNQRLTMRHWMAIFTISCGLTILLCIDVQRVHYDTASLPYVDNDENTILTGNLLVICAQILQAFQLVYVEKYLKAKDLPPMLAVGWQGLYGVLITFVMGVTVNFLPITLSPFGNNSHGVLDDLNDAFVQMADNRSVVIGIVVLLFSCTLYNYAAHSIMKFSSSSNCLLADELRVMLVLWLSLVFEWEYLNLLILAAFWIIAMGIIAYRTAIFIEWYRALLARMFRNSYMDINVDPSSTDPQLNSQSADAV